MKKTLQTNINRIDLLTDARIGEIKGLMKSMADQVLALNKRVTIAEADMLRRDYEQIPAEVMALTKSEFELRQDLALCIAQANETKDLL